MENENLLTISNYAKGYPNRDGGNGVVPAYIYKLISKGNIIPEIIGGKNGMKFIDITKYPYKE